MATWIRKLHTTETETLDFGGHRISAFRHDDDRTWRWTVYERNRIGEYAPRRRGTAGSVLEAKKTALAASRELGWLTAHELAALLSTLA